MYRAGLPLIRSVTTVQASSASARARDAQDTRSLPRRT
jgi:hypothetical protein